MTKKKKIILGIAALAIIALSAITYGVVNDLNQEEKLKKEISSINEDSSCYVEYLDIIKSFLDMKNPTREIMNRLIDKIYVTKDKKLEIHYRIKKSEVLI